jgi:hypothetical protein
MNNDGSDQITTVAMIAALSMEWRGRLQLYWGNRWLHRFACFAALICSPSVDKLLKT